MADQNELAQLESERDRLLAVIAYHDRRVPAGRAPAWFIVAAIAIICGIGTLIVAGLFSVQIALSDLIFSVVFLGLAAYILTRKIAVFGITFWVAEILTLSPAWRPAGEPDARQHLADCEARIMKLKEGRS